VSAVDSIVSAGVKNADKVVIFSPGGVLSAREYWACARRRSTGRRRTVGARQQASALLRANILRVCCAPHSCSKAAAPPWRPAAPRAPAPALL